MKALWIAGAACVLGFAGFAVHAKSVCDIHHLGYTQAQCDQCSNMTWSVSRIFPKGECVASAAPAPVNAGGAARGTTPPAPAPAKTICDIHHLGYTQAQCDQCSNMRWSVTPVTPRGECVGTAPPQTINLGGAPKGSTPTPTPASTGSSCKPTHWGGATVPLSAPNFSMTGVRVTACANGYDFSKSQFQCSTGVPALPLNASVAKTNVTCNRTTGAPGGNPQVTINGTPCCL